MGFMDNFTSDKEVEVKQPDYYAMMREAAKAELLTNGIKGGVPGFYLESFITGVPAKIVEGILEETTPLDCDKWSDITRAVKDIYNEWHTADYVTEIETEIKELVEDLAAARRIELYNIERRNKTKSEEVKHQDGSSEEMWSCDTCQHKNEPITAEQILDGRHCDECEDGSNYQSEEREE